MSNIDKETDWIDETPKDWNIYKIKNIGRFSTSSINKKTDPQEKKIYLVNYMDIYKNKHNHTLFNREYMVVSANESQIQSSDLKKGDVLFTPSSETIQDIGLSAVVLEDLKNSFFSYHILRLRFYKDINLKFKKYLFNNYFVYNQFSSLACGTTRMTLKLNKFKNTYVVLPDQQKQEKIANYLDEKSEIIDSIISNKKKLIKLLEEQKQVLIYEIITNGLIKNRDYKNCEIRDLGKIPSDWEINKIKYCTSYLIGGTPPSGDFDSYDGNLPWATIFDLKSKYISDTKNYLSEIGVKEYNLTLIPKDSLLFSFKLSIGRVAFNKINMYTNEAIISFISSDKVNLDYAYYMFPLFIVKNARKNIYGADMLNQELIRNAKIILPPKIEQEQIANSLNLRVQEIDNTINKYKKQITLYKEYKEALIFEAVTGKITI